MDETPLIPTEEFVSAFNVEPMAAGQRFRGSLDPLVMFAWHLVNEPRPGPFITGLPAL
jgi:hypothetical protein